MTSLLTSVTAVTSVMTGPGQDIDKVASVKNLVSGSDPSAVAGIIAAATEAKPDLAVVVSGEAAAAACPCSGHCQERSAESCA